MFGFGSWEKIEDRFLLASSSTYSINTEGGEATHTLTVDEMPTHAHDFNRHQLWTTETAPETSLEQGYGVTNKSVAIYRDTTTTAGSGMSHNNMPPYLAVNIWKRVN